MVLRVEFEQPIQAVGTLDQDRCVTTAPDRKTFDWVECSAGRRDVTDLQAPSLFIDIKQVFVFIDLDRYLIGNAPARPKETVGPCVEAAVETLPIDGKQPRKHEIQFILIT